MSYNAQCFWCTSMDPQKLVKYIRRDLTRQAEVVKAKTVLNRYQATTGKGVPLEMVRDAVKTLFSHTRRQTRKKEQTITASISNYVDKIDDSSEALRDLVGDVMYDMTAILDTLSESDVTPAAEEEPPEDDGFDIDAVFRKAAIKLRETPLSSTVKCKKNTSAFKTPPSILPLLPEAPTADPENHGDDASGGGGHTDHLPGNAPGGEE